MHIALSSIRRFQIVKLILQAGADVNQPNPSGSTPLHLAVYRRYQKSTIRLLLKSGANVNKPDNIGKTPLITAVYQSGIFLLEIRDKIYDYRKPDRLLLDKVRCLEPVRMLLEAGAQINRKNYREENALATAMLFSKSEDHLNLCMLLYSAGETLDDPTVLEANEQ